MTMSTQDVSNLIKKIPALTSKLKKEEGMSDGAKIALALLAGLAAGAAVGILFAPDKGAETRDKLSESLGKLSDSIKETAVNEIDRLSSLKTKVVDNIKTKMNGEEPEYQDDLEHA
jgi:gas vesicle protein